MTLTLSDEWEVAIASRLSVFAFELGLSMSAPPKQAGKFLLESKESVDFLLSETTVVGQSLGGMDCRETLFFRIFLSDRYSDSVEERRTVNQVVELLIGLFGGFLLPRAATPLSFERSRFFAPVGGSWYTELTFTFASFRRFKNATDS